MSTAHRQVYVVTACLCAATLLLGLLGMTAGSRGFETELGWLDPVVQDIRLPRTVGAWLAGGLLGLAGALAQGLFRNPLADPYLLGSAPGAALGVALALELDSWGGHQFTGQLAWPVQWLGQLGLTGVAFVGAWGAVLLTLLLARGVQHTVRLLLAGVVVGVVLGACTSLLMATQPALWPAMQAFLLGYTGMLTQASCVWMGLVLLLSWLAAWRWGRLLDGLTLGEDTARSLGLQVGTLRTGLLAVMALCTATAVAQTGLIAFVGLVAPHLVRSSVRVRFAMSSLLSVLMGGVLLCLADMLARSWMAPQELPVGVLTAIMGGSYLMWRLGSASVSLGDRT